ncbi:DUF2637 domain-containing protein [Streptomyces sp. NPDC090088]|uniref:DUF2637 domain-containing protein n=1 Tax=Streptomyces sp. NPDC090088 TaxID=3365944 RepID=UPI00380D01B8
MAAYASYVHQWSFALQAGADRVSASLWPLSVDGLLLLATLGLLKPEGEADHRARWAVRTAFLLGIAVSLAANVAAAPRPEWRSVLVAGWPPVALLLSVELLVHRVGGRRTEGAAWASDRDGAGVNGSDRDEDPLLVRARKLDLEHREMHQRPASAETLRKELHVGAQRSRTLVALVRGRKGRSEKGTEGHAE